MQWTPAKASCALHDFSARDAKELLRNERIVFLGDSLARNMYQSLQCMLLEEQESTDKVAAIELNDGYKPEYDMWSAPHNLSIRYKSVRIFTPDQLDSVYGASFFVDTTLLIVSTGAWWMSYKGGFGADFNESSAPRLAREAVAHIAARLPTKARAIWRLPDLTHAIGAESAEGSNDPLGCRNALAPHPLASVSHAEDPSGWKTANPSFLWIYDALLSALSDYDRFAVMDVADLSGSRPDAHPSTHLPYRGHFKLNKTISDCQHWFLGTLDSVPDAWNYVVLNWVYSGMHLF